MTETITERVLATFGLTPAQCEAALERGRDVVVTAGAGSGKTRTLVARYATLLADGFLPRRVVAITFTEKAAREMRSRVRDALRDLAQSSSIATEREQWLLLGAQLDSARIGTIHSLCAEILRAHPAEAGIDPLFEVIDEDLSAALRAQVVVDTLASLVSLPQYSPLFQALGTGGLQSLLEYLLKRRLGAQEAFSRNIDGAKIVQQGIADALNSPALAEPIADLRTIPAPTLLQTEGDKLGPMVTELLSLWYSAESALAKGDVVTCAENLFQARREKMSARFGSKASAVKGAVAALRQAYDDLLDPLIGGAEAKDTAPSRESEALFGELQPLIRSAFDLLHQAYQDVLRQRQALDFDDLENGAAQLIKREEIRVRWQGELDYLLVDEFQDTNTRQREIVESLTGTPGRLFIVGDARQSIYRFRGADVTVFRSIQKRVRDQGGLVTDLEITYRAHDSLLLTMGDVLSACMGTEPDATRPYYVPYSPLTAYRKLAPEHVSDPYMEIVLGTGEDAGSARPVAARALALRLLTLKASGEIRTWDDVALLFRASNGAVYYEDTFEEMGIPYVTISGHFYDRPEIRDVLNILQALADPADNVAMAGLLRSPAFGLTDAALYQLRWQSDSPVSFWTSLSGDLSVLNEADQTQVIRALKILKELLPQVDRVPVAELLKGLIDITDYRAILAADDSSGSNGRLWRNLDKLVGDAQTSGQVNVRDFLQYLATLSDAGAREGEAPVEAYGAVRLMTIHKSKGLEFPVVVLADAGREPRAGSDAAYLLPELGLSFKLEPPPMLYRLAKWQDKQQSDAEAQRLLYVALTRAQDKLLISGHAAPLRNGSAVTVSAWMADLCGAAGIDIQNVLAQEGTPLEAQTASGHPIHAWCMSVEESNAPAADQAKPTEIPELNAPSLYARLMELVPVMEMEDEPDKVNTWRVTVTIENIPPGVIGQMVHKAIELWLFPEDSRLIPMLESAALNAGLASLDQRIEAVRRARELLERLRMHPLWVEINSAPERYHEVPYSRMVGEKAETGYIDVLYQTENGWQVVDFKTDSVHSASERTELLEKYSRQMHRYSSAVETLLGRIPQLKICFLDDAGNVTTVNLN